MISKKERVFITVKTYPNLSVKYDEIVCTAGITEKGEWIRIYPIPFRKLEWEKQYKKYQWIDLELSKNTADFRPESHKPTDLGRSLKNQECVKDWEDRKKIIFKAKIYKDMDVLVKEAKEKNKATSLAIFKPKEILDFKIESVEREWDKKKLRIIEEKSKQLDLFDSDKPSKLFEVVKKLPYKFSYKFKDESGKEPKLMIEDWEIGALYWKCLKREADEKKATQKVKEKYFHEFKKKDLYLFLGTTKEHHYRSPNPFIIIGVFYPPVNEQMFLL